MATAKDWERLTMTYLKRFHKAERLLALERKRFDWVLKKCPSVWVADKDGILLPTWIRTRKAADKAMKRELK